MKRTRRSTRRVGFTLIEVLLVIAILLLLAGISVGVYFKIQAGSEIDAARILVEEVAGQVDLFRMHMKRYPSSEEGLQELVTEPEDENEAKLWRGPYLKNKQIPKDPWQEEIKYELLEDENAAAPYRVYSTGPDKEDGSEDDISSVVEEEE